MIFLLALGILLAIVVVAYVRLIALFDYFYQKETTPEHYKKLRTVDLKDFTSLFSSVEWKASDTFKNSLFLKGDFSLDKYFDNYLHAGIWGIDGVGIIPKNIIEFYKIDSFLKKEWKKLNDEQEKGQ
jgi:hypothetical protein